MVANNSSFENITFDTGEVVSAYQYWEFPTGTSYSEIPDGNWFWKVRTKDNDGDWGLFSDTYKFMIDANLPASLIKMPSANGYYNLMNSISGNASDGIYGTGITKVEILINCVSDDQYWSGAAWTHDEHWLNVAGVNNWSYDSNSVTWTSGWQYNIRSRATDLATNLEVPGTGNLFNFDKDRPSSSVEFPLEGSYINHVNELTGGFDDTGGSGVESLEISIRRTKDNFYWNGSGWEFKEGWLPSGIVQESWVFNTSEVQWTTNRRYSIQSRAIDRTGNSELPVIGTKFMFDNAPPINLSIQISNNKYYTNESEVDLVHLAEDWGSGLVSMAFSLDNETWRSWQNYTKSTSFELPEPDGKKALYFKVRDRAGNIAMPVFDSIILDTTPPENLNLTINGGKYCHDIKLDNS